MRKALVVGLLPESKNRWEGRAALTPADVRWLRKKFIEVEVVTSKQRAFKDAEYKRAGATVVPQCRRANLLLGIKEPAPSEIRPDSVYMIFSHTTKGQVGNRPLLKAFLKQKSTLVDYEHIVDPTERRLVYFGRFAGICGMLDTLHLLGLRHEARGLNSPFRLIRHSLDYPSFDAAKRHLRTVARRVRQKGFPDEITPFIVGITGHGNVASGVNEVLQCFDPEEIHPRDIQAFRKRKSGIKKRVFKIIYNREEKLRARNGKAFYFEEYLANPKHFESNLDLTLGDLNVLMHCSYWDKRYPRLVTEKMVRTLSRQKNFRLAMIGDLSCDVRGGIELTHKTASPDNPVYVYDPAVGKIRDGVEGKGIAVMAVDNLPCEFSKEATEDFSRQIREYVYQIAAHGVLDITDHAALPREIRQATVTQSGRLTDPYHYLKKYI